MPYNVIDPAVAAAAPVITHGAPRTSYGKTLAAMLSELDLQLGARADVGIDRLTQWINDAYVDLATSLQLPELVGSYGMSTVAAQPFYLLPEQVFSLRRVAVIDDDYVAFKGRPLLKTDSEAYRREPDKTDKPTTFFREGDVMVIWPTPDAVWPLAVDFKIRPDYLVNATDSPMVKREWHEAILKGARAKALDGLMEFELAGAAENTFISLIRRRIDVVADEQKNRMIGSSIPRSRKQLYRSHKNLGDFDAY